ncbi:M20/M25/M40 family metallo-hydrolase [Streptomyces sp. BG9H]|uniref:M20/M25/M40 family metallo-hydrolase n=1 Tax=Streptomyces anatolicus TaxID=2675858 RepID=A0ABS6YX00_9ACTN|nr:M20 family metallopeptidase [Streptomyces anatolicus]MBW5425975.1 M20/M25/M40 family metallo-hydrolase [Streptomyces anatolicus]
MVVDLEELVVCESYSADLAAVARSAEVVAAQGARLLGAEPERLVIDGVTHLRWVFGTPRALLLGHHDTVWPMGSLATHPWSVREGIARGPGIFDMKAGLVQMFHALASLPSLEGVCVLVTGDEEVGSDTSLALIEKAARQCVATFVLEASGDGGALKTARKGTSAYELVVHGKAAHSGLEPDKGINAAVGAAHLILALEGLAEEVNAGASAQWRTTVVPTVVAAGSASNTVPAEATVSVDVRVPTLQAQERVDAAVRALEVPVPGARLEVRGGPNRPPLEEASSAELFARARAIARRQGLGTLLSAAVGGASDGNFTAGLGCPTLDGLGAVGAGAHADHEHVVVAEMVPRARLLAALVEEVVR